MALLPVAEALARVLAGVKPLPGEPVVLGRCGGRVLAKDVKAKRDQPPFPASAMDGYAVRAVDLRSIPARLKVAGMSAAGHAHGGQLKPQEAVRIFTGAPVPAGADTIVIQENCVADGEVVVVNESAREGQHIRKRGLDFTRGETLLHAGVPLNPRMIGLAAAMNCPVLQVRRKPRVAILATGDELALPGGNPRADQIMSSNSFALAAMIERFGATAIDLGIAPDNLKATGRAIARGSEAEVLVTSGGASVGDHDLVQEALKRAGVKMGFWKIAMRPGKPLMFGLRGRQRILGLPGNPVSSLVCARLFLKPLIDALLGLPAEQLLRPAVLSQAMKENDMRQDYVRARLETRNDGTLAATPFAKQDSSMQRLMAEAECLIVRAPFAAPLAAGEAVQVLPLDF